MKPFASAGYLLSNARLDVRLAYTGFLLLVCMGMGTMAVLQWKHIGPTPTEVAAYFRGGERNGAMTFPKTVRELVELTHFHSFIMGVVFLVMAHLMIATTASDVVKRVSIVLAFAGLIGDLIGVWLIRFVSARFAYTQVLCWAAEWVGFTAFVYYPVREMWFSNGSNGPGNGPTGRATG